MDAKFLIISAALCELLGSKGEGNMHIHRFENRCGSCGKGGYFYPISELKTRENTLYSNGLQLKRVKEATDGGQIQITTVLNGEV